MGLMQGRIREGIFLITDCFRLPVEGTETRVNAGDSANEYMIQFTELNERLGSSNDFVCGWYHSHPGYGCWLSGIDVETQFLYQSHQDPFLAIVIDPLKTALTGRVEIGAFRTYPRGYNQSKSMSSVASIPAEKISDYGIHCNRYYPLEIEFYKSRGDEEVINKVWSQYWSESIAGLNWPSIHLETANTIREALDRKSTVGELTEVIHKCACERLHTVARDLVISRTVMSSGMDISAPCSCFDCDCTLRYCLY
jgi:COP9 signalosome complex subunit 5